MRQNRITERLRERAGRSCTVLPYFTAGFPDCRTVSDLIQCADVQGAPVVEVGFPYSDSIADGPVIQASFHEALARGFCVADAFALASEVRSSVQCGLAAMASFSLVHRFGLERFMATAAQAGFDGVILPDLPAEEAEPAVAAAESASLCHIGLIAPTTTPQRRSTILRNSSGFIYQIAVAGTTGERATLPEALQCQVEAIKSERALPVCVGFGISRAAHVRAVCRVADGAIVGSAIIRRISEGLAAGNSHGAIIEAVARFLTELTDERTGA